MPVFFCFFFFFFFHFKKNLFTYFLRKRDRAWAREEAEGEVEAGSSLSRGLGSQKWGSIPGFRDHEWMNEGVSKWREALQSWLMVGYLVLRLILTPTRDTFLQWSCCVTKCPHIWWHKSTIFLCNILWVRVWTEDSADSLSLLQVIWGLCWAELNGWESPYS